MENTRRGPLLPAHIMHNKTVNAAWDGAFMLLALLIVAFRWEVAGTFIFLGAIAVMMIGSDRLSDSWVPLILMTVFLTRCYDSYDVFIRYAPFYAAAISTVFFHVVYYWAKPQIGASFPGLCAVAVAVTVGGAFFISAADYFRPIMLYYVGCLGALMPVLYLVAKPRVDDEARERFLRGLFLAGCLSVFAVAIFYLRDWRTVAETRRALQFQSANNLVTFLMMTMPTGFYLAKKHRALIAAPAVMYLAILLCNSRSGTLLGSAEFFLLLLFFCFYRADRFRRVAFVLYMVAGVALCVVFLPRVLPYYALDTVGEYVPPETFWGRVKDLPLKVLAYNEARLGLLKRAWHDFCANPLFGTGLGYRGNSDLYDPARGAMNWYHMWGPQILGSLGVLGVLCYGYQLFGRIRLAFTRRDFSAVTLSLCYLGLFLISQVNPGEFCPFPYAVTATLIFLLIEPDGAPQEDAAPKDVPADREPA